MDAALPLAIAGIAVATAVLAASAAAETALERANDVRIQALAARGDKRAQLIAGNVQQPTTFLGSLTSARVLSGAVIVALAAYIGASEYGPLKGAFGLGLAAGVFVAIVEMTVGMMAARQPEYAAIRLYRVVRLARILFGVPAFILSLPARLAARSLRVVKRDMDTDILALVEREEAAGGVEEQERRMIRGVIALEDKSAREIMVPRIDVAAAEVEDSIDRVAQIVNERGFSRVPVYRENIDDIVGIAFAKDLLRATTTGGRDRKLVELLREPVFIPESKRLDQLLTEMRASRAHMAIVVDEYGGTAGIVTIEDLLEEIVGEIEDEYDVAAPQTEVISEDEAVVDGAVPTAVLKELFGYEVDSDDYDTVGGFLMNQLGRLPAVGDEVVVDGLTLKVLSMAGRRVRRLRVARTRADAGADAERGEAEAVAALK